MPGEATLVIELRDSPTGALLGRVLDRRETLDTGMQWSNRVTNTSDFRNLFKAWASITVKGTGIAQGDLAAARPADAGTEARPVRLGTCEPQNV